MRPQPDECDTTSPAPLPTGALACPRCGSERLESRKSIYCCPFCFWAGDEWSIITISQLRGQVKDLEEHIMEETNFIAGVLDCTEENYKEVLERYFFIGITEHIQLSLDKLAVLLNKRKVKLPVLNRSQRDSQISSLPPGMINRFKEANELDYRIYNYCLEKFKENI